MCKRNGRAVKVALLAISLFLMVWFSIPFAALRVRDSVVTVHIWSDGFLRGQASGVIVDNGIILTARHVVNDANEIQITTDNGKRFMSTEFYEAANTDLGLIIFDADGELSKSRLSFCEAFVGQTVFGIGSRYGLNNSFFQGVIGKLSRSIPTFGSKQVIQLDIAGNPGDSGCGIFNRWGNVVGILVGGGGNGITFIVPAKVARLFLNQFYANKAMKECE